MAELFPSLPGWSAASKPPNYLISPTEIHNNPTVQTTIARLERPLLPLPPNPTGNSANDPGRAQSFHSMRMSHMREGRTPTGFKFVGYARLKFSDTDFILTTRKLCIGCSQEPNFDSDGDDELAIHAMAAGYKLEATTTTTTTTFEADLQWPHFPGLSHLLSPSRIQEMSDDFASLTTFSALPPPAATREDIRVRSSSAPPVSGSNFSRLLSNDEVEGLQRPLTGSRSPKPDSINPNLLSLSDTETTGAEAVDLFSVDFLEGIEAGGLPSAGLEGGDFMNAVADCLQSRFTVSGATESNFSTCEETGTIEFVACTSNGNEQEISLDGGGFLSDWASLNLLDSARLLGGEHMAFAEQTSIDIDIELKTRSLIQSLTLSTSLAVDSGILPRYFNPQPFVRANRKGGAVGDVWQLSRADQSAPRDYTALDARTGEIVAAEGPMFHLDEEPPDGDLSSLEDSYSEISWTESSFEEDLAFDNGSDSENYEEDENDCEEPYLSVHGAAGPEGFGSISERHIRLFYDSGRQVFVMDVLGESGAFINGVHVAKDCIRPLYHGDVIRIGSVSFTFQLPKSVIRRILRNAILLEGGVVHFKKPSNGDMSLDFQDSDGNPMQIDVSSESDDDQDHIHVSMLNHLFATSSSDGFFSTSTGGEDSADDSDQSIPDQADMAAPVKNGWERVRKRSRSDEDDGSNAEDEVVLKRRKGAGPPLRQNGDQTAGHASSDSDLSDIDEDDTADVASSTRPGSSGGRLPRQTKLIVKLSVPSLYLPKGNPLTEIDKNSRSLPRNTKENSDLKEVSVKRERPKIKEQPVYPNPDRARLVENKKKRMLDREREASGPEKPSDRETDTGDRPKTKIKKKAVGNGFHAYSQVRTNMLSQKKERESVKKTGSSAVKQTQPTKGAEHRADQASATNKAGKKSQSGPAERSPKIKRADLVDKKTSNLEGTGGSRKTAAAATGTAKTADAKPKDKANSKRKKASKHLSIDTSLMPNDDDTSDSVFTSSPDLVTPKTATAPSLTPLTEKGPKKKSPASAKTASPRGGRGRKLTVSPTEPTQKRRKLNGPPPSPELTEKKVELVGGSARVESGEAHDHGIGKSSEINELFDPTGLVSCKDKDKDKDKDLILCRDKPLINGIHVNIDGLPLGCIIPPRTQGPGRPPKDGMLSKREKTQIKKTYYEELRQKGELPPDQREAIEQAERELERDIERDNERMHDDLVADADGTDMLDSNTTVTDRENERAELETGATNPNPAMPKMECTGGSKKADKNERPKSSSESTRVPIPADPMLATGTVSAASIVSGMAAVAAAVGATVNPISGLVTSVPAEAAMNAGVNASPKCGPAVSIPPAPVTAPAAAAAAPVKAKEKEREKESIKPVRRGRSPSPDLRIENYTSDQLQRPAVSYLVIIYDILHQSTYPLNLGQIYRRMMETYPYFRFEAGSKGWQSSVRHNLAQNKCFVKAFKDGKGYAWSIDPSVDIFKDRKGRASSPIGTARGTFQVRQMLYDLVPVYSCDPAVVSARTDLSAPFFAPNPFREQFQGPDADLADNDMARPGKTESSAQAIANATRLRTAAVSAMLNDHAHSQPQPNPYHLHSHTVKAQKLAKGKEPWTPVKAETVRPRQGVLPVMTVNQTIYPAEFRTFVRAARKQPARRVRQNQMGPGHGHGHGHALGQGTGTHQTISTSATHHLPHSHQGPVSAPGHSQAHGHVQGSSQGPAQAHAQGHNFAPHVRPGAVPARGTVPLASQARMQPSQAGVGEVARRDNAAQAPMGTVRPLAPPSARMSHLASSVTRPAVVSSVPHATPIKMAAPLGLAAVIDSGSVQQAAAAAAASAAAITAPAMARSTVPTTVVPAKPTTATTATATSTGATTATVPAAAAAPRQGLRSDHVENGLRGFRKWFLDVSQEEPVAAARIIDNALRVIRNPNDQLLTQMNSQELELARTIVLVLLDHAVDALPNVTLDLAVATGLIPPINSPRPPQGQHLHQPIPQQTGAPVQPQTQAKMQPQVPAKAQPAQQQVNTAASSTGSSTRALAPAVATVSSGAVSGSSVTTVTSGSTGSIAPPGPVPIQIQPPRLPTSGQTQVQSQTRATTSLPSRTVIPAPSSVQQAQARPQVQTHPLMATSKTSGPSLTGSTVPTPIGGVSSQESSQTPMLQSKKPSGDGPTVATAPLASQPSSTPSQAHPETGGATSRSLTPGPDSGPSR